ncbi:MAG: hypothetical protein JSV62_01130 [Promethearchaeota archaeon]|nr:MAG: hypothetical protein JSV62_01130 [Candidatus Lokiarchaeota archaeon]
MAQEILKFTKLTFIIHFIIGLTFTILFWIPDIALPLYVDVTGINIAGMLVAHAMSLTIGCLFAGLTVSSLLGIFAKEWKQVKIVAICEVVWLVANLVTSIISFSVFIVGMAILTLVITIVLIVLFILTCLQQEDKINPIF